MEFLLKISKDELKKIIANYINNNKDFNLTVDENQIEWDMIGDYDYLEFNGLKIKIPIKQEQK